MVGWSRRNRESRQRHNRWWATLSDEEKTAYRLRQEELDKKVSVGFALFFWFMFVALVLILRSRQ